MKLIDADLFKENMEKKYGAYARQPQEDIDAQPTVDAMPVVRCKDCQNRKTCRIPWNVDNDFFCADGERR